MSALTVCILAQIASACFLLGHYTIPDDPEGAADFAAATQGIPYKVLAGLMGIRSVSQITKWRTCGNVPPGRIAVLAQHAPDVARDYVERQARRRQALVIPRSMLLTAADALGVLLEAVGWRPVPIKASLPARDSAGSVGSERRTTSAA